jgi:hypothetical protein
MARRNPFRRHPGRPATHGGHLLTRALRGVSLDALDQRSRVAVVLKRIRHDLTDQCGGDDEVTPALAMLIDECAIKSVITRSVGEWLLAQESLLRADGKELLRVVEQHNSLQKTLTRMLSTIGLDRRAVPVLDVRQEDGLD